MHDVLYENQDALEDEDLVQYALGLNLEARRLIKEVETTVHRARIREDFRSGVRAGVNGTPCFFINGERHDGGYDYNTLLAALTHAAAWHP
jgi:protein-disulfide isomerase